MEKTKSAHRDINASTIVGRLVRDCEVRDTPKGKVVKFRIASSNGEQKTTFIDCESWNINEKIIQYLVKGKEVNIIQSRLMYDEWEKNGEKRSKNYLSVRDLTLGKSPNRNKNKSFEEESFDNEIESFLDEKDSESIDPDSTPF